MVKGCAALRRPSFSLFLSVVGVGELGVGRRGRSGLVAAAWPSGCTGREWRGGGGWQWAGRRAGRDEPTVDPERDVPYRDRRLVECLREGAGRFGWQHRPAAPASMRDGRWLVGYEVSGAIRGHFQGPTAVRARWEADGTAVVQTDMTDIGTGAYTILTQVAADSLGLSPDRVRIDLGRSASPSSWGPGGSWGATNACTAAHRACLALREKVLAAAGGDTRSPLHGLDPGTPCSPMATWASAARPRQ